MTAIPCDLYAERAMLGCLLADPTRLSRVPGLNINHFYDPIHRRIWEAIVAANYDERAMAASSAGFTLMVADMVRSDGRVPIPSTTDICELHDECDGVVPEYWQPVLDTARCKREIAYKILELGQMAAGPLFSKQEVLDAVQALYEAVAQQGDAETMTFAEVVRRMELDKGNIPAGTPLGIDAVDAALGYLVPAGSLVIVAGRTAMGKSAFVQQAAFATARTRRVLLFSPEMPPEQVAARNPDLARDSGLRILTARKALQSTDVVGMTRKLHAMKPVDLVVVDYLQYLADPLLKGELHVDRLARITRTLKTLARQCNCVVLAAAQLNRRSAESDDHRPMLSGLRGSGDIEQDADIVLLLHRPGYYTKDPTDTRAEVDIAKNRFGPTYLVPMVWNAAQTRFEDAP